MVVKVQCDDGEFFRLMLQEEPGSQDSEVIQVLNLLKWKIWAVHICPHTFSIFQSPSVRVQAKP